MKRRIFIAANITIPLLLGAVIYFLTSSDVIFVEAVRSLGGVPFQSEQDIALGGICQVIRYYLLDILWAYALFFSLYFVIGKGAANLRTALIIAIVFSSVMEIAQLISIVPGYFDGLDIVVEVLAEVFAALIIKKQYEEASNI